eukprot:9958342-Prorocentrum_lima.AAC.1
MTSSLVGSEMCIRDRPKTSLVLYQTVGSISAAILSPYRLGWPLPTGESGCLLYTSDAADDM